MKCNLCGVEVLNSWVAKMYHAVTFHPDLVAKGLMTGKVQQTSFNIGAKIADGLKGKLGKWES